MPATDSVYGAIVNAFSGNSTLTALLPGGMYTGQIPETVALPFVAILPGDTSVTWMTGTTYIEEVALDLVVFAQTAAAAETAAFAVNKALQFVTLAFTNAVCIAVYRTGYRPEAELLRAPNGEIVYSVHSSYQVYVQRSK